MTCFESLYTRTYAKCEASELKFTVPAATTTCTSLVKVYETALFCNNEWSAELWFVTVKFDGAQVCGSEASHPWLPGPDYALWCPRRCGGGIVWKRSAERLCVVTRVPSAFVTALPPRSDWSSSCLSRSRQGRCLRRLCSAASCVCWCWETLMGNGSHVVVWRSQGETMMMMMMISNKMPHLLKSLVPWAFTLRWTYLYLQCWSVTHMIILTGFVCWLIWAPLHQSG